MKSPTIIMIHGFRGTHHGLELIAEYMSEFDDIQIPDLPGFGDGPRLEQYGLDAYVEWLHDYILAAGHYQPVLLGHSFGSIVSAAYAAKYPETISKLILVNPIGAPALEGPKAVLTKLTVFYYWAGTKLPSALATRWLSSKAVVQIMSSVMAKTRDRELRQFIHGQHHEHFSSFHSPDSVSESFQTSVRHSVRDFAPKIFVPTLLIAGEKDDITPLFKQRELAQKFPNAHLEVIQGVGHLTHYETPDQVAAFATRFILH